MINMEKCPFCEKSMPKHILVLHLKKRHSEKIVVEETNSEAIDAKTGKVIATDIPGEDISYAVPEPKKWYEKWDAGEIGVCAQCKTEWPAKLMGFHLKLEHGL